MGATPISSQSKPVHSYLNNMKKHRAIALYFFMFNLFFIQEYSLYSRIAISKFLKKKNFAVSSSQNIKIA